MLNLTAGAPDLWEPQAVEVFRKDCRVVFGLARGVTGPRRSSPNTPQGSRSIKELSQRSRLRLLHNAKNAELDLLSMITLTYPAEWPGDGREVKRHLDSFRKALRRRFPQAQDLWFLEFQARGAPHFHVLLSCRIPFGRKKMARAWVAATWFRIVDSGDKKHLMAGTAWENCRTVDGAARYVAKYACKTHQKAVPPHYQNVGRFWGGSRLLRPEVQCRIPVTAADIEKVCEGKQIRAKDGKILKYLWDTNHLFQCWNSAQRAVSGPYGLNGRPPMKLRVSCNRIPPPPSNTSHMRISGKTPGGSCLRTYRLRPHLDSLSCSTTSKGG